MYVCVYVSVCVHVLCAGSFGKVHRCQVLCMLECVCVCVCVCVCECVCVMCVCV